MWATSVRASANGMWNRVTLRGRSVASMDVWNVISKRLTGVGISISRSCHAAAGFTFLENFTGFPWLEMPGPFSETGLSHLKLTVTSSGAGS